MSAMITIQFDTIARECPGATAGEPNPDKSPDAAWIVLEAANDLGDTATVAACRRVIDAGFKGAPAAPCDLNIVLNYFR
jgi:hypothetical protein